MSDEVVTAGLPAKRTPWKQVIVLVVVIGLIGLLWSDATLMYHLATTPVKMIDGFDDTEPWLEIGALETLSAYSPVQLARYLDYSPSARWRRIVCQTLSSHHLTPEPAFRARVPTTLTRTATTDPDPMVRKMAYYALIANFPYREADGEPSLKLLVAAGSDGHRLQMLDHLAVKCPQLASALPGAFKPLLASPTWRDRYDALIVLAKYAPTAKAEVAAALRSLTNNPSTPTRELIPALAKLDKSNPEIVRALDELGKHFFASKDAAVQALASSAWQQSPNAGNMFVQAIKQAEPAQQARLLASLRGGVGPNRAWHAPVKFQKSDADSLVELALTAEDRASRGALAILATAFSVKTNNPFADGEGPRSDAYAPRFRKLLADAGPKWDEFLLGYFSKVVPFTEADLPRIEQLLRRRHKAMPARIKAEFAWQEMTKRFPNHPLTKALATDLREAGDPKQATPGDGRRRRPTA